MARSLRARITLGLGALALALLVVAAFALTALARLGSAVDTILRENYRSVIACEEMNEALEREDSAAQFASTGRDDIAGPMLATHRAAFDRAFAVEAANITLPGEAEAVREMDARYREYLDAVDRALAAPHGSVRGEAYFSELLPSFWRVKDAVARVLRMNQAHMEASDRTARGVARRGTAFTLAVGVAALALALWLAWRLPGTSVGPIGALADAARAVAGGDLDVSVADLRVQELAPLAEAFQKMVVQLRAFRQSSLGELLAARDLAETTVACLLDPVVVCGGDGDVLLTNDAAERAFGVRAGSAAELRAAEVSLPEEFARARDEVFATGLAVVPRALSEAMRWRDRHGERSFLVRAAPLRSEAGEVPRVIVVAQDVTRLRRIDDLKSDMVATVSHEFKTPLTSLRMATHLLLEPSPGPLTEAQREIVTAARDDTERLRALVDELLDLVRIETEAGALRRTSVDPRTLLLAAADAHRAIARDKGVALDVDDGGDLPRATLDVEKIGIVLSNLVSNALRHTPSGGAVRLGAEHDGGALRITIRDTGEGVTQDQLARLQGRDGSATRASGHEGWRHGFGLTIAKEIVLQHGGELTVESAPGAGSTFTLRLPDEPLHAA